MNFNEDNEDDNSADQKNTLVNELQMQFEKIKIKELSNPDIIESYRDDKFIRNGGEIAKQVKVLNHEIQKEMFEDKSKLAENILDDIEKQESWQIYSTLLFSNAEITKEKIIAKPQSHNAKLRLKNKINIHS